VVSDPVTLKHMLNSPIFEHGPSLANTMNLLFEEKCLMAAKDKVSFQLILHTDETRGRRNSQTPPGFNADWIHCIRSL
jgi:hypothetical protein